MIYVSRTEQLDSVLRRSGYALRLIFMLARQMERKMNRSGPFSAYERFLRTF